MTIPFHYHLAQTRRIKRAEGNEWQAYCVCGWEGLVRITKGAAEEDGYEHDKANNESE